MHTTNTLRLVGLGIAAVLLLVPPSSRAHCDSLDGPVVRAAEIALESGDVTPVLKWVHPDDEAAIRDAFANTVRVRSMGADARDLADRYFFETVVRIHRESEGAPYTGLKPGGTTEPIITMADAALASADVDALVADLTDLIREGVHRRFDHALESGRHADDTVAEGRAYVAAYVSFVHYVEAIHSAAASGPSHEEHR
jgi:hypothetical protein